MSAKKKNIDNEHGVTHVTGPDDNIFADLGFAPEIAARLLAETDALIQERQDIRMQLAEVVVEWIDVKQLKQTEAAQILKISRPRVSDLYRRQISKFSVDTLIDLVFRTGKKVQIKVA